MRTVPLANLLSSMQPGTALMGLSFTPRSLRAAVTTRHMADKYPTDVPQAASLDPDSLLRVVQELQIGGLLLGGSALFRTNGLTQFGARHLVSRVGGDPFSNIGETEESMQLPIALWTRSGDDPANMIAEFLQA